MDGQYIYIYMCVCVRTLNMFCVSTMMMIIIIIIDDNNDQQKCRGWKETCLRFFSLFQTDVANEGAANRLALQSYALLKSLQSLLSNGYFR
jgi:hypothetical protein